MIAALRHLLTTHLLAAAHPPAAPLDEVLRL
jgi:hypothetical protein